MPRGSETSAWRTIRIASRSSISIGITDFRHFVDEVAEVLRPGGVFLSIEGDMKLFDENLRPIRAEKKSDPVRAGIRSDMRITEEAFVRPG